MAFDLYYASCNNSYILPYVWKNDVPLLYSQVNDRVRLIQRFTKANTKGKLLVDSGAHTAHTKGIELDVDEYINFANEHMDDISLYVQVDKIPGKYLMPKTSKDFLEAPAISWENYKYMRSKSKDPSKLVPVFHQGEDFKWLQNMCDARFDGEPIPYIGLSPRGDVSVRKKYDFCANCFKVIQNSSNPNVKTHAFGATSLDMLENLPFTSADSTTWVLVSAYGQVWVPGSLFGKSDVVGVKVGISYENVTHPITTEIYWNEPQVVKDRLDKYFESIGYTVEELASWHTNRALASLKFCENWAKNYKYKGLKSFKSYGANRLF